MTLDTNDPRLTAYALGELTDDKELAAVEAAVEADDDLRAAVDDIRFAAELVAAALEDDSAPTLTDAQRGAVHVAAASASAKAPLRFAERRRRFDVLRPRTGWQRFRMAAVVLFFIISGSLVAREVGRMGQDAIFAVYIWNEMVKTSSGHDVARRSSSDGFVPSSAIGRLLTGRHEGQDGRQTYQSQTAQRGAPQPQARPPAPSPWDAESQFAAPPGQPRMGEPDPLAGLRGDANEPFNTESYDRVVDNPFRSVADAPLSTFSIDVDTASYANVRRFLDSGVLPPKDAVRIEEMINYFDYDYAPPTEDPFAVHVEVASAPWQPQHRLVRVGLKGRELPAGARPPSNLVFLLDVSGSMDEPNKLPLVRESLAMLAENLTENDRVAIVVYAGASGLVLPSTPGSNRVAITDALEQLHAGGSTNGGEGLQLAYDVARRNMIPGGVNRVILATDGDFNIGVTDQGSLVRQIEEEAESGVALTVLGYGMGNYKDATLEQLADHGDGNYAYIDTIDEARKVLVEQIGGTLVTIAKDVKIQVEFNPEQVSAYRLLGYENRMLAAEDFNDDTKDAGEIGAGHTVTALYEVVPVGVPITLPGVDPLRYQQPREPSQGSDTGELLNVKLRHKPPSGFVSKLAEHPVVDDGADVAAASSDLRFAAAVAAFGMILRDSPYRGDASVDMVRALADDALGTDAHGYRRGFVQLVQRAAGIPR